MDGPCTINITLRCLDETHTDGQITQIFQPSYRDVAMVIKHDFCLGSHQQPIESSLGYRDGHLQKSVRGSLHQIGDGLDPSTCLDLFVMCICRYRVLLGFTLIVQHVHVPRIGSQHMPTTAKKDLQVRIQLIECSQPGHSVYI